MHILIILNHLNTISIYMQFAINNGKHFFYNFFLKMNFQKFVCSKFKKWSIKITSYHSVKFQNLNKVFYKKKWMSYVSSLHFIKSLDKKRHITKNQPKIFIFSFYFNYRFIKVIAQILFRLNKHD